MPTFKYKLKSFTSSGGDAIPLAKSGLFLIVGPNNSGKSKLLDELELQWNGAAPEGSTKVVSSLKVDVELNWDAFESWIRENYSVTHQTDGLIKFAGIRTQSILRPEHLGKIGDWINRGDFRGFVLSKLDTESRLQLSNPANRIEVYKEKPEHFIHVMQSDPAIYKKVQDEVKAAFNLDLIIDYAGGKTVTLYVGNEPRMENGWDRVHPDYCKAVRSQMEPLENAGDGVRSYVVSVASAMAESQPVLMIDEPEAFLHPPQSRRMGRLLADLAAIRKKQIIVTTHSSDLVSGALSSGKSVSVMRLDRKRIAPDKEVNRVHLMSSKDLRALWENPLLKSSSAIDGIFHKGVIVTESDSDSRFYEALILRSDFRNKYRNPADFHFVQGHGKSSFKTLANSYTKLHVPVVVVSDFDLLRERSLFRAVIESLGAKYSVLTTEYNILAQELRDQLPIKDEKLALSEICNFVAEIRDRLPDGPYKITREDRYKIRDLLENAKKWSGGKKYGITKLKGIPQKSGRSLLEKASHFGLFVIPSGELESWNRKLPQNDKQSWILEALKLVADNPNSFQRAEKFVDSVVNYLELH